MIIYLQKCIYNHTSFYRKNSGTSQNPEGITGNPEGTTTFTGGPNTLAEENNPLVA